MRLLALSILLFTLFLLSTLASAEPLDDGFYSMLRRSTNQAQVKPLVDGEVLAQHDPKFLGDEDDTEVLYIVLREDGFVPIALKKRPVKTADTTQRTQFWLGITLADEAADEFEEFTRKNLGGTMAIVVGGHVVTMHTIKQVIKGGKLQISRCGDKGCEVLYKELDDNLQTWF